MALPGGQLVALEESTLARIHARAADSVFWELDPAATSENPTSELDKGAWLLARCYAQNPIGFSIAEPTTTIGALATCLFCPPEHAPGAARMPTAPISDDAWVVTSLHIATNAKNRGWEAVLLDATITAATRAGAQALEVFGLRLDADTADSAVARIARHAASIGLTEVSILESAGFRVVADHPVLPRLRLTLPPAFDLMAAHEIADLLAAVPAC